MYTYVLILIFTGQYVTTTTTVQFTTEDLCKEAKEQIVTDYERNNRDSRVPKLTAYCSPISK